MAEPLKNSFGPTVVDRIAQNLPVDRDAFVSDCLRGFEPLSLMDRARHVADVMHDHLDPDPATAVTQVARSLGTDRPHGMDGFFYNPHSFFIARYGLPAFEESMAAQYELTKLFTAEFCIRPFIVEYPQTMDTLRTWTGDPDEHVRRLVSEGTRPRLPWATRLPQFQRDPGPVLELLDRLKDGGSEYVRRSVANNLNDIAKDNPQVALDVAGRWYEGRERLVKHALRTLLKAGDPQALAILGYSTSSVSAHAELPHRIAIGSSLPLEVTLTGHGRVLADIVVHFVKANGSTSQKVFRGAELDVHGRATLRRTISFRQHSTRRHYPGEHRIEALINGRRQELGVIDVVAATTD